MYFPSLVENSILFFYSIFYRKSTVATLFQKTFRSLKNMTFKKVLGSCKNVETWPKVFRTTQGPTPLGIWKSDAENGKLFYYYYYYFVYKINWPRRSLVMAHPTVHTFWSFKCQWRACLKSFIFSSTGLWGHFKKIVKHCLDFSFVFSAPVPAWRNMSPEWGRICAR